MDVNDSPTGYITSGPPRILPSWYIIRLGKIENIVPKVLLSRNHYMVGSGFSYILETLMLLVANLAN